MYIIYRKDNGAVVEKVKTVWCEENGIMTEKVFFADSVGELDFREVPEESIPNPLRGHDIFTI